MIFVVAILGSLGMRGLSNKKEHLSSRRNKVSIIMTGYLDRMSVLHIHMCDMM